MELLTSALEAALEGSSGDVLSTTTKEGVVGLQGGFLVRNVLTDSECITVCEAVRALVSHNEIQIAERIRVNSEAVAAAAAADEKRGEGEEDTAAAAAAVVVVVVDEKEKEKDNRRRPSQHHTPCRVAPRVLCGLAARLRPYLAPHAGPTSSFALNSPVDGELSSFLRLYDYMQGDFSSPHYDRSFSENEKKGPGVKGGRLVRFSAYSILLYLNDDFEGGRTTFFPVPVAAAGGAQEPPSKRSRRGNTPADVPVSGTAVTLEVVPKAGDALVFPHGKQPGCHPDPLHEGSVVTRGRKTIIRTDIVYKSPKV